MKLTKTAINAVVDVALLAAFIYSSKSELLGYISVDKNFAFAILFYPALIALAVLTYKCKNFAEKIQPTLAGFGIYVWLYRILFALSLVFAIKGTAQMLLFLSYLVQIPLTAISLKSLYCGLKGVRQW